jgi:hypothetical protein
LPNDEQLAAMYSSPEPLFETGTALPLHRSVQLDALAKVSGLAPGSRLLDYGCCGGFYLDAARRMGFAPTGVEFSAEYARRVSSHMGAPVLTPSELDSIGHLFDVIHLGHVLEHLPNPGELLGRLGNVSHAETLWLIDGPLENNLCLSRVVVDLGSRLRGRPYREQEPQHLTCTTAAGQRQFFERTGFKTLRFDIMEQPWPLPDRLETGSLREVALWSLAKVSMSLSRLVPMAGNIFHFVGQRAR